MLQVNVLTGLLDSRQMRSSPFFNRIIPGIIGVICIASLTGYLIALIPQATVLAAVITGLLGLLLSVGLVVYFRKKNTHHPNIYWIWCLVVIIFCISFSFTHYISRPFVVEWNRDAQVKAIEFRQKIIIDLQQRTFEKCTQFELDHNLNREKVGLPPLSSELICNLELLNPPI